MALIGALGVVCGLLLVPALRPYVDPCPRYVWFLSGLLVGALFTLSTMRFGLTWQLVAYLFFAALSVLLAIIDAFTQRLPNRFTMLGYPILLGLLTFAALMDDMWWSLLRAGAGALTMLAIFVLMRVAYPAGIGMGDVKLSGVIGMALGWISLPSVLWGTCAGFLLVAVLSLVLLAAGKVTRKSALAYGPSMLLGAWTVVVASGQLAT